MDVVRHLLIIKLILQISERPNRSKPEEQNPAALKPWNINCAFTGSIRLFIDLEKMSEDEWDKLERKGKQALQHQKKGKPKAKAKRKPSDATSSSVDDVPLSQIKKKKEKEIASPAPKVLKKNNIC
jgi:hypothetical protein